MIPIAPAWQTPSPTGGELKVSNTTVHLWRLRLEAACDRRSHCLELLSSDECQRAERFRFERDRHRFILTRGWLRILLGRYLHCPPATVQFAYNDYGKPVLAPALAVTNLTFNLSHSQQIAVYAITCDRQIGVDVESIREIQDVDRLAQKVLSEREWMDWQQLAASEKMQSFFTYWTCKEAYVKALGIGLSHPMPTIDIAIDPPTAKIVSIAGNSAAATHWSLALLSPAPDYRAALVVQGQGWQCEYWDCVGHSA